MIGRPCSPGFQRHRRRQRLMPNSLPTEATDRPLKIIIAHASTYPFTPGPKEDVSHHGTMSHKAWFAAVAHSDLPPPRGLLSIRAGEVSARERRCAARRGRPLRGVRARPGQRPISARRCSRSSTAADGAYDFVNEKGETLTISFHALGGDLFVGQANGEKRISRATAIWCFGVAGERGGALRPAMRRSGQGNARGVPASR